MGSLFTGIVMAFLLAGVEIHLVREFRPEKFDPKEHAVFLKPFFRLGPWLEKSMLNSFAFSMMISIVCTALFPVGVGPAGLIAGFLSTFLTQPYYSFRRNMHKIKVALHLVRS